MRILVTGGAGFIGSNVVDAYLEAGHEVTVLDDLSRGRRENVDSRAQLIVGDLRNPETARTLRGQKYDLLNHHAAQIDVRVSVSDPAADAELNLVATLRLFQMLIDDGLRQIIFASSGGAIYGDPVFAPQTEEHPERPISPYGCAKLAVDQYLHYYRVVHSVRAVSLRYGNVYGPRQRKDGEAGVIAVFAGALLDGKQPHINGTGEQTRDFVYVDDVVRANVAAAEHPLDGRFNVGTGVETSVNTLYREIRDAVGSTLDAEYAPAKAGEQMRSVLDGSRLRTAVKLPEPISVREGLRRTVAWLRSQRG